MDEFEAFARQIADRLDLPDAAKERIRAEVVAHLQDEARRCCAQGMAEADARRVAMERFGSDEAIAQLLGEALAKRQKRFRVRRAVAGIAVAIAPVLLTLAIAAWFQVFDDAFAGSDLAKAFPWVFVVVYLGAAAMGLLILAGVAARLAGSGLGTAAASAGLVLCAFIVALVIFQASPLRDTIGTIRQDQTQLSRALNLFAMRLYLCWTSLALVAVCTLCISRRRREVAWLAFSAGLGLASALLWGLNYAGASVGPWAHWMKWPKLLSSGALCLMFVLMCVALAWTIASRRECHSSQGETGSSHVVGESAHT